MDNYHHQQSHQEAQTKRDSQVYGRQNAGGTITPVHASNARDPRGTTTIDFAEANRQIEIREAAHIKRVEQQKKAAQHVQKNVPKNKQQDKPKQQAQPLIEQKQPSVQPPKDPKEDDKNKTTSHCENDKLFKHRTKYSQEWNQANLKKTIDKFAPEAKEIHTNSGKILFKNEKTGIQVVYDKVGNYFRIENPNLTGKRVYLDLEGNLPNNKFVNGKQVGRSKIEYQRITHFNNVD